MLNQYSTNTQTLTMKLRIEHSDEVEKFIWRNSNHYRKIWNIFVDHFKNYSIFKITRKSVTDYVSEVLRDVEEGGDYYVKNNLCRGISAKVGRRFYSAVKTIKKKYNTTKKIGKFHFKALDPYRCSFAIENKLEDRREKSFSSNITIIDKRHVSIRVHKEKGKPTVRQDIYLSEDIFTDIDETEDKRNYYYNKNLHYMFRANDIKTIIFLYELGKLYLLLQLDVRHELFDDEDKTNIGTGIDFGVEHAAMMYTDIGLFVEYSQFIPNYVKQRLDHLEDRVSRLFTIMNRKKPHSKNYEKVREKFRKTWAHIAGIYNYWRHKISKDLCMHNKAICVDTYKIMDDSYTEGLPANVKRRTNKKSRKYGMYNFNENLKYKCVKYNTLYIDSNEAKINTTNRCSVCGHINKRSLTLDERTFICDKCDNVMDRDENASVNCYKLALDVLSSIE